jgi:2-polyprenyl-3-methyl-5-hydroxy-6-metoxy-1,4-benzoquinol methylase
MVTAFELLEHVKDPKLLLKEIDRVLAPGGSVLISTPAFESPLYGKDDEKNKCHIRLYTMESEDYEAKNKYGNVRKATSIHKEIGKERIKEIGVTPTS